MNLPADLQRLVPLIAVLVVALVAAVLVLRGVGGGSGTSAQQMFDRALKEEPKSAALNMRVTFSLENGATGRGTTIADSVVSGEGADTAPGKPSRERLHFTDRVAGKPDVSLDEISTGDGGYVGVDGVWYRLSDAQYRRVFEPDKEESFVEAAGFDPRKWLTNPKLGRPAHVGGVDANHIEGEADADMLLTDLGFYKQAGSASPASTRFMDMIRNSTKRATMDVFAGKQDGILRKLSVVAQMDAPKGGPPLRATLTFALGLHEVNEPVTVEAPKNALPPARIARIPRAKLGDEADDILGAPVKAAPKRRARGKAAPRRSRQAYVSCVQAAQDLPALERCQALLP